MRAGSRGRKGRDARTDGTTGAAGALGVVGAVKGAANPPDFCRSSYSCAASAPNFLRCPGTFSPGAIPCGDACSTRKIDSVSDSDGISRSRPERAKHHRVAQVRYRRTVMVRMPVAILRSAGTPIDGQAQCRGLPTDEMASAPKERGTAELHSACRQEQDARDDLVLGSVAMPADGRTRVSTSICYNHSYFAQ